MVRITAGLLMLIAATAAPAAAQALLPAKGEAYASVLFTNIHVENHFLPAQRVDIGHIDSNVALFDVTYGVTDRVAVTVGIPFVAARYQGAFPHQPSNPEAPDLTGWNGTFQDFRFNVRYNLVRGPVAVTPYVGTVMPSHEYDFIAHSAAGKQLRELQVGVAAATLLDRYIPGAFLQGRFGFALVERTLEFRPNYSSADVELGYFITPGVRVFGMASGRRSHDGIDVDVPAIARVVLRPDQLVNHDKIVREHYFNLGVGTSVSLSETVDLFGSFVKQMAGRNTHEVDRAISVGLSWNFKRRDPDEVAAVLPPEPAPAATQQVARKSLVRCLCQKTAS